MTKTNCFVILLTLCIGCRKKFDEPPYVPANEGAALGIKNLKARLPLSNTFYKFAEGDTSLTCTVTADETSGNFLKTVFVRDDEGAALQIKLLESGGIYTGDRIRVRLSGNYLVSANNMISLDSVNTETHIVKLSSGHAVSPVVSNISQLNGNTDPLNPANLQSQLVELNGVEFDPLHRSKKFADAVGKSAQEYQITDCNGRKISVRTSGWANFASQLTPAGKGKLIAIVTQYNAQPQLVIRNYNELNMRETPCVTSVTAPASSTFVLAAPVQSVDEKFDKVSSNSDFTENGWINFAEKGSVKWRGHVKAGTYQSLRVSSYGTGENNTVWLISPPVIYKPGMKLNFKTGVEYFSNGHTEPVMAYLSTDFNGLNFTAANWTKLSTAVYAGATDPHYTGATGLISSGNIDLSLQDILKNYQGNFFIAFRYAGTPNHTTNIYLDDVHVQ